MKKEFCLLCCLSSSLWGKADAAQFTEKASPQTIHKGNLNHVNAERIHQEFHEHHHAPTSPHDQVHSFLNELKDQNQQIAENFKKIKKVKEGVVIIGPTGWGKSTFLTWMGSKEPLKSIKDGPKFILKSDLQNGLFISHDKKTGTLYATPVEFEHPHFSDQISLFCDCPGFGDVRGESENIKHMISLSNVIHRLDGAKILLVISAQLLEDTRNSTILTLFNDTAEMFFHSPDQYGMGAFVLTKCGTDCEDYYIEKIRDYEQDLDNCLTHTSRTWIRFCLNNPDHLFWMYRAERAGDYDYSNLENWGKLQRLSFRRPNFTPCLTPASQLKIHDLFCGLNEHIKQELQKNKPNIRETFYQKIRLFEGNSQNFLKLLRSIKDIFFNQVRTTDKERASRLIENIEGLTETSRDNLNNYISLIEQFKNSLGGISNIAGKNITIDYDCKSWMESIEDISLSMKHLDKLKKLPESKKTVIKDSFQSSNQCTVREEEEFQLPNIEPWNGIKIKTESDILSFKSDKIKYEFQDSELTSIPVYKYILYREGEEVSDEFIEERGDPIAYEQRSIDIEVIPGSFNVQNQTVDLNVARSYQRADQSSYRKEMRIHQNPAIALISKTFYEHHDEELYSHEMVPYHTVYEGQTLDLEPQKKEERLPYKVKKTSSDVDQSTLHIQDGAVLNRTVEMIKTIEYERGDRSEYTAREVKTVNVEQAERNDEARRKKYIDYIVRYETIQTVLNSKEEYYFPIPAFARGHEKVYRKFVNGKLVFDNREGQRKEFPFSQFADTCEGEFDLSGLRYRYKGNLYNVNERLSINLGFRRGKNPAHAGKVEVWILPKFLMGMHIDGVAKHYKSTIWDKWTSEVGILWTSGDLSSDDGQGDYNTRLIMDEFLPPLNDLLSLLYNRYRPGTFAHTCTNVSIQQFLHFFMLFFN